MGINYCKHCGAITNKHDSSSKPQHKILNCGKCGEKFENWGNTIMKTEQLIEEAVKEFDKVFPCIQEGCDNYGTIPEQDGDGDWQPAQCEFCYKIRFPVKEYFEKALNTIASKSAEEVYFNKKAFEVGLKNFRKLRLIDHEPLMDEAPPADTVLSVLKKGLGGMFDDQVVSYIYEKAIKYYLKSLSKGTK